MDITIEIDLEQAARELNLPLEGVQNTVALLDDGNTVPFITRYRKDHTGALDEEQIRRIQEKVGKMRALAERKQTILKSIQAQGRLTAELAEQIRTANSPKRLEDLYLPFKPKKQTLATVARQRGLEPLAREVLDADPAAAELRTRAASLVDPDKELSSVEDVLSGVRHLIAEWFSERADVRGRLRKILQRSGKLVCSRIEPAARHNAAADEPSPGAVAPHDHVAAADQASTAIDPAAVESPQPERMPDEPAAGRTDEGAGRDVPGAVVQDGELSSDEAAAEAPLAGEAPAGDADKGTGDTAEIEQATPVTGEAGGELSRPAAGSASPAVEVSPSTGQAPAASDPGGYTSSAAGELPAGEHVGEPPHREDLPATADGERSGGEAEAPAVPASAADVARPETLGSGAPPAGTKKPVAAAKKPPKRGPLSGAISKKEKKRQRLESAFKDYFEFQESIARIPPHRVLAINRGERARILRAKIEADVEGMLAEAESLLIPPDHPHAEFLQSCVRDALGRLVIPSLERELRREMTERAEEHAVEVFARNLRKLLLQPPVRDHRVLAIDPGFRSGCKLAALDEFGNVLGHEIIHVIGKEEWIRSGRKKLVELVARHRLNVVAIGNGAGCRETEQLVVDVMANELKDEDVAFLIVNEAGASVYSTSALGREELPTYDAVLRSSISIGRRLLDPLSELVKINPANIGVGMYQHDVKAKHLRTSLDAVVESCVNYVGVDVNTASPALLRYVSGMNQLTARRLCEYRAKHGPFSSREELRLVPGLGEATFVQAAGFLKIAKGENPLDATWIHPESYDLARKIMERAGCSMADLATTPSVACDVPPHVEPRTDPPAAEADEADTRSTSEPVATHEEPQAETGEVSVPPSAGGDAAAASPPPDAGAAVGTTAEQPPVDGRSDDPGPQAAAEATPAEPATDAGDVVTDGASIEGDVAPACDPAPALPSAQRALQERVRQLDVDLLANELAVSPLLLGDICSSLARPGRDPREDFPAPVFRRGIVKLEDLEPGMKLSGTVLNVVDFGAFVDIGLPDSGLVHISRLADRFVRDPHEVVGVGDVVTVWVVEIDKQRRRVSLTAIEPGTARPPEARRDAARPRRPAAARPGKPRPQGERRAREGTAGQRHGAKGRQRSRPAPKPKVVTPITKEMAEGKEPLRSFSDLMQFYQKKHTDENDAES